MEDDGPAGTSRRLSVAQVCSARNGTYGAVASMMNLADSLKGLGHTVEFVGFRGRGLGGHVRSLGYTCTDVKVKLKVDPLGVMRMAKLFRQKRYDVVHAHLSSSATNGLLAARFAGIPGLATVHGLSGKLSFFAADHLIAVSRKVQEHLVLQGVAETKISIVPNCVPFDYTATISKQSARRGLGLPLDVPVLGTVARLTPLKGVQHFLIAARHLSDDFPHAQFLVIGDGEQRAELEAQAESLGLRDRVRFLGYRSDVASILPALDVFLFPTLREAMGIAVIEAMACGLPIVATAVGGVPEVVTPECGVLVSPTDGLQLADCAAVYLRDPELARITGERAKERARTEFSPVRAAQRVVRVYDDLIATTSVRA